MSNLQISAVRVRRFPCVCCLVLVGWLIVGPVFKCEAAVPWLQDGSVTITPSPTNSELTVEKVSALRKQVEEDADLEAELKTRLLEVYQKAIDELQKAAEARKSATEFKARIADVSERLAAAEQQVLAESEMKWDDLAAEPDSAELNRALSQRQVRLQEARAAASKWENASSESSERRKQLDARVAGYPERRDTLQEQLKAAAPPNEPPSQTTARQTLLRAQLQLIEDQLPSDQAELALLSAEREAGLWASLARLESRRASRLQREIDTLTQRINQLRQAEADETKRRADQAAAAELLESNPRLKKLADETQKLAEENSQLVVDIAAATQDASSAATQLAELKETVAKTKAEVDRVGLTGSIGLKLRKQMLALPDSNVIRSDGKARQELMREIEFKRGDYKERLDALDPPQNREIEDEASFTFERQLETNQYDTLSALVQNYDKYFEVLDSLDRDQQDLAQRVEDYRDFVAERVLWIRSNRPIGFKDLVEAADTILWLLQPEHLSELGQSFLTDIEEEWIAYLLFLFMLGVLLFAQHRCRRELGKIGESAARTTFSEFIPTLRALLLTVVIALPLSAAFLFLGWRLYSSPVSPEFSKACGQGFLTVGIALSFVNFVRRSCIRSGLGEAHFGWPEASLQHLRRSLYFLVILMLPLLFLTSMLPVNENPQGHDGLERTAYILSRLILAYFLYRLLHPEKGVFRQYLEQHSASLMARTRRLWFFVIVASPMITAAMAAIGYFYTADELSSRVSLTLWVCTVVFYARALAIRWFTVSQRKLRIEQARQRRAALLAQAAAPDDEVARNLGISPQDELTDLQAVGDQTLRLINSITLVGLFLIVWFVWADVLPALRVLDDWSLWSSVRDVSVEETLQDGTKVYRTEPRVEPVTVGDILLAGIIFAVTWTATRNVPGLMEIMLLKRLPLEPAIRYAIRTVTSYALLVVGLVTAFNTIGIGWAQVQWLIAALTVGLGFGMQEIFANFVSGLIILFERPVRIGDIVTIDGVTGVVSRVQIRATTITDWDRKEYIVPNREFITGRVLNWTLTDKTNRIVITVGVAYGSDLALARSLLLEAANEHPLIMDDPGPLATTEGFGDNSINLVLRCYLPNLDNRLPTVTALYEDIDRRFRDAGLEISFPQRDLHLRSVPPGMMLPLASNMTSNGSNESDEAGT